MLAAAAGPGPHGVRARRTYREDSIVPGSLQSRATPRAATRHPLWWRAVVSGCLAIIAALLVLPDAGDARAAGLPWDPAADGSGVSATLSATNGERRISFSGYEW